MSNITQDLAHCKYYFDSINTKYDINIVYYTLFYYNTDKVVIFKELKPTLNNYTINSIFQLITCLKKNISPSSENKNYYNAIKYAISQRSTLVKE